MRLMLPIVLMLSVVACKKADPIVAEEKTTPSGSASSETIPVSETVAPAPKGPSDMDRVLATNDLAGALAVARPLMGEKFGERSQGAVVLTVWALKNLTWADVALVKDETSYAKIMKDVDEERGKRLCSRGRIVQINVAKHDFGKHYEGLLSSGGGNLFHFAAVGSTGELVQGRVARFCGVSTGRFDYTNSGGGTGHAVDLVGMFDLPENKVAK